jgi:hypothetical protein
MSKTGQAEQSKATIVLSSHAGQAHVGRQEIAARYDARPDENWFLSAAGTIAGVGRVA